MSQPRIVSVFGATSVQGLSNSSSRCVNTPCLTQNPGSAVVNAILKDGTFTPRAIIRNPESEAALQLKARGVEVVMGDSLDKASLVTALRGTESVFGVCSLHFALRIQLSVQITARIFPLKAEGEGPNELTQGKNMIDAAKEVGVKFFIFTYALGQIHSMSTKIEYSGTPSIAKISGGKYKNCLHYDRMSRTF
jgi:hypothetical protein